MAGAFAINNSPQTFTSVQRRESTLNTRRLHADQEKEWTASRCNRLLRALTSRVAILTKEISRYSSAPTKDSHCCRKPQSEDADWIGGKKRVRRTYTNRAVRNGPSEKGSQGGAQKLPPKKGRVSLNPGEVTISTPLLARVRDNIFLGEGPALAENLPNNEHITNSQYCRTHPSLGPSDRTFQLSATLRELRHKLTSARYTTYEGIYNGLEALLRTTNEDMPICPRKGVRPLVSMALRAVPRYIADQEQLLQVHIEKTGKRSAIQSRDISSEIYDELESFGTSNGWKNLRTVVRKHGVQVIGDAIKAGLLDVEFCAALVTLCMHNSALDEAESLLSSLLNSAQFPSPTTTYETATRPFAMLRKFTQHTGRESFQYRLLSDLIATGALPTQWLATKEFGSIWTEVVQSLFTNRLDYDALCLLSASISQLCRISSRNNTSNEGDHAVTEASKNTLSSILAIVSSIVILSKERESSASQERRQCAFSYKHITTLLGSCWAEYRNAQTTFESQIVLLLLANILVQHEEVDVADIEASFVQPLLAQLQSSSGGGGLSPTYSQAALFICRVAQCCGKASFTSGFDHLQHFHLLMEALAQNTASGNLMKGLIVDSALAFAQKVPDRDHLDYAANMDAKFCTRGFDSDSSLHNISVGDSDEDEGCGFRWEEGIGEWVTATPAASRGKRKYMMDDTEEGSECDTPYRPPPNLRRRVEQELHSVEREESCLSDVSDMGSDMASRENISYATQVHSYADGEDASSSEDPDVVDPSISESEDELGGDSSQQFSSQSNTSITTEDPFNQDTSLTDDGFDFDHSSISLQKSISSPHPNNVPRVPRLNRKIFQDNDSWQLFEDSALSNSSSVPSEDNDSRREFIDRAPRLGRRALRSSQTWRLFDESDDELSSLSVSSHGSQALRDVTNTGTSNARRQRHNRTSLIPTKRISTRLLAPGISSDSEDELCI